MDFLKTQLERLQAQFAQLTASQKMLSVSLVAIMVMTLAWWGRYAGTAEMEPLLGQDLSPAEFNQITANLRERNIPFTPNGTRILVPADRQYEALGGLAERELLPRDTSSAFTDLMGKMGNPLNPQQTTQQIFNEARQMSLAEVIRHFPGVESARVQLDTTEKRRMDNPITAKASVSVNMKRGEMADSRRVKAIANWVAGAVAGLHESHVSVIVNGVTRRSGNGEEGDDGQFAGTSLEEMQSLEAYSARQVSHQLQFCYNVYVKTHVTQKTDSSLTTSETYDPKGVVSRASETTTEVQTTSSGGKASGDVGVNPNSGSNQPMTVGAGAGGDGQTSSTEKTTEKIENKFSHNTKVVKAPPAMSVTSVSVAMPRSFFIKAYKAETRTDKDPSEAILEPYIKKQLESCRGLVKNCLSLPSDDALAMETYIDLPPAVSEVTAQATGGVALLLGSHGKDIVLGVLALASLFMVSMMVRKSGAGTMVTAGARTGMLNSVGMPTVGTTVDAMMAKAKLKSALEDDAAEVGEGGQALDGIELDDDSIRAQQVIEQVSNLVKENPDVGANLIKRWMTRA